MESYMTYTDVNQIKLSQQQYKSNKGNVISKIEPYASTTTQTYTPSGNHIRHTQSHVITLT